MTRFIRSTATILLITAACAAQASRHTANPASGSDIGLNGRVNMVGAIVSKACDIALESRYQSIAMPDETVSRMKRNGQGRTKPFSIHLVDCTFDSGELNSTPWQFVQVTFEGADKDGLFKVNGEAGGVALEITGTDDKQAYPGKPLPFVVITSDDIRLDYKLRLKSTHDDLRPGNYSSVIKYRIDYF